MATTATIETDLDLELWPDQEKLQKILAAMLRDRHIKVNIIRRH